MAVPRGTSPAGGEDADPRPRNSGPARGTRTGGGGNEQQRGCAAGGVGGDPAALVAAGPGQSVTATGARSTGARRFSLIDAVPLTGQLRSYSKRALGRDAVAALSIAAALVPQSLAYGQVAGL